MKNIKTGVQLGVITGVAAIVALGMKDAWRADKGGVRSGATSLASMVAKYAKQIEIKGVSVRLPGTKPSDREERTTGWYPSALDVPAYNEDDYEDVS